MASNDVDKRLFGEGFFGKALSPKQSIMGQKFVMPPFSVLDARQGAWASRKQAWLGLGLKGEEGRARDETDTLNRAYRKTLDGHGKKLRDQYNKRELKNKTGLDIDEGLNYDPDGPGTGTSVFDPVLTELCYRWFCLPGGRILDPFAGGSTRGIVAGMLGYNYTGIEVREVQVDANRLQSTQIGVPCAPNWILGDSTELNGTLESSGALEPYDLVFACPPYYDLELYSHDNRDGSTHATYEQFMEWYKLVFAQAIEHLKDNRFLVVIIGEIRDQKTGIYRNFVGDNIRVFCELNLKYYNELVLVTKGGSLPLRAGKYFTTSRKVGKSHQNVLVFWKGDTAKIKEVFKNAEI